MRSNWVAMTRQVEYHIDEIQKEDRAKGDCALIPHGIYAEGGEHWSNELKFHKSGRYITSSDGALQRLEHDSADVDPITTVWNAVCLSEKCTYNTCCESRLPLQVCEH